MEAGASSSSRAAAMRPQLLAGTRDVLPDEMRELRDITERVRAVFTERGYGEVATPALEFEGVLARGGTPSNTGAYRLFDDSGDVLVLRSDMTIPIARVVGTRYPTAEPPLRFCYLAHAYRSVKPSRGHAREVLQAGIELVGAPAPDGTAEAIAVLCAALDAAGLEGYRIGVGDASLYPAMLAGLGVGATARERIVAELVARDFVSLERELEGLPLDADIAELLLRVPQLRGGPEVLDLPAGPGADAAEGMRQVHALLAPEVADRVIFDLGLVRSLGYYTGAVFEVYDQALGAPIGGGGRYDELLGRFGRALPAVGWALDVEQLHAALVGERQGR